MTGHVTEAGLSGTANGVVTWSHEPCSSQRRFPYLVIRFMAAIYQREEISIRQGDLRVHVGHRDTFIHHPDPFGPEGSISPDCRKALLDGVLQAVQRLRFRMAVVWSPTACTFVEPSGAMNDSNEPPSGGLGSGGTGGTPLPKDLDFDRRI